MKTGVTVRDIVRDYLLTNGYDGLYSDEDCACALDALMFCADSFLYGECWRQCHPGYRVRCAHADEHDYDIQAEKP